MAGFPPATHWLRPGRLKTGLAFTDFHCQEYNRGRERLKSFVREEYKYRQWHSGSEGLCNLFNVIQPVVGNQIKKSNAALVYHVRVLVGKIWHTLGNLR